MSWTTSYYHYDGLHNAVQLTDATQTVTDTAAYNAFGEKVEGTGSTTNPFGYKGELGYYANPDTDDLYVRARTYDPLIARFASFDALGFEEGLNVYSYVRNRPLVKSDPSGRVSLFIEPWSPVGISWYHSDEMNFGAAGETGGKVLITCECLCRPGLVFRRRTRYRVSCSIHAMFKIIVYVKMIDEGLDPIFIKGHIEQWGEPPTVKNTYGHEQLHVWSTRNYLYRLANQLKRAERRLSRRLRNSSVCRLRAAELEESSYKEFWEFAKNDHGNPPPAPEEGRPYPPLYGVFPSEGTRVPDGVFDTYRNFGLPASITTEGYVPPDLPIEIEEGDIPLPLP